MKYFKQWSYLKTDIYINVVYEKKYILWADTYKNYLNILLNTTVKSGKNDYSTFVFSYNGFELISLIHSLIYFITNILIFVNGPVKILFYKIEILVLKS